MNLFNIQQMCSQFWFDYGGKTQVYFHFYGRKIECLLFEDESFSQDLVHSTKRFENRELRTSAAEASMSSCQFVVQTNICE